MSLVWVVENRRCTTIRDFQSVYDNIWPQSTRAICEEATKRAIIRYDTMLLHPFNGLFPRQPGQAGTSHQKGKPFRILLEQEMMEWQWQQLNLLACNFAKC